MIIDNKQFKRKNKKGLKGMAEPNCLISNYNNHKKQKYLNVSINLKRGHVGMEEWLSQLFDKQCPSGFVGSIPAAGVTLISNENINNLYKQGGKV